LPQAEQKRADASAATTWQFGHAKGSLAPQAEQKWPIWAADLHTVQSIRAVHEVAPPPEIQVEQPNFVQVQQKAVLAYYVQR
jgi:hypothetical protein